MEAAYSADNHAQVAFGLLDPSHAYEFMEKENRRLASCCESPMTVTDAMLGPSFSLTDGETSGKRLSGLADLGAEAQSSSSREQMS